MLKLLELKMPKLNQVSDHQPDGIKQHSSTDIESDIEMVERNHNGPKLNNRKKGSDMTYGIEDVPPWYLCLFLGFQVNYMKRVHV